VLLAGDPREALAVTLAGDMMPVGERLLEPTRIYVRAVESLFAAGIRPSSMSHITGGGLWENPARTIRAELAMRLDLAAVRSFGQPLFTEISERGGVPESEMYRVFNMGIGFMVVTSPSSAAAALRVLEAAGERPRVVGELVPRTGAAVELAGVSDVPLRREAASA
jgi:phosphoribosylformylglycinamidine cyclo-ligase